MSGRDSWVSREGERVLGVEDFGKGLLGGFLGDQRKIGEGRKSRRIIEVRLNPRDAPLSRDAV